jgi:thiamine-monophosphate kinase
LKISDMGEFGMIAELREMLRGRGEAVLLPPGDDAAVFQAPGGALMAFTTDAMVEGVHFDPSYVSWHSLGYKALAVNISDLAAMGGSPPSFALVVLGLSPQTEGGDVRRLYEGMIDCADEFSCSIAGGDIVGSPRVFVSVSLTGALLEGRFLTRSGARPGQSVMVTGTLGDSALGMRWLMQGGGGNNPCAKKFLYPQPRLSLGRRALQMGAVAAIDISDGLLRDLGHICEESGVAARIFADNIPLSAAARATAQELHEDPLAAALSGGEDYELLLVAEKNDAVGMRAEIELTAIGETVEGSGVTVLDAAGRAIELKKTGYDHFKEA